MSLSLKALIDSKHLPSVEAEFLETLSEEDRVLLLQYRDSAEGMDAVFDRIGVALEQYLVKAFAIDAEYAALQRTIGLLDPLTYFYEQISQPAVRKLSVHKSVLPQETVMLTAAAYTDELSCIQALLKQFEEDRLYDWSQWVWQEQLEPYITWRVFSFPKKIKFDALVQIKTVKPRVDYQFTGATLDAKSIMQHVHYCIECHYKNNDSCSTGFWVKRESRYKVNPLGRVLTGCPLNQKISQMHRMRKKHHIIAALAIIMVDNPLCLVTGDRICNDCMVACIYQKVEPVDTPSVESDTVKQVLGLPYGAEIYLLLAKWNPLKSKDHQYHPSKGSAVAVVGMGPAGFAMSYYLLMAGCQVMGFDGLPIPECEDDISQPIQYFYDWVKTFNKGQPLGFGGVIDYGITARWDKRLIVLIWVLLHRFPTFSLMGNTRLGGAITIERLKALGFDHVALATGAGLPKAHKIQNKQGIYFANEFLMRLHLSGVMKKEIRIGLKLPIVVIGGGLTAVDAATESLVYYTRWVMQVACWSDNTGSRLFEGFSDREVKVIEAWVKHGIAVRSLQKDPQQLAAYLQKEGGVHILYRRCIQESPAYKTNALELTKALEQGVVYHEYMDPISVESSDGWVEALYCNSQQGSVTVPAKTVLIATGSKPNIAYHYEHREPLLIEGGYYKREDDFFAESKDHPKYVSILGDLHPKYHGSVVGALASAKDSYAMVLEQLISKKVLNLEAVKNTLSIHVQQSFVVTDNIIGLTVSTAVDLPIGSYLKVALLDKGVLLQLKAVVIEKGLAWVNRQQTGADLLLTQMPTGVLGPSGTRLLRQKCSDTIHIIADKENSIWAAAIASSAIAQKKRPTVYLASSEVILPYNCEKKLWKEVTNRPNEEVYFCLQAEALKQWDQYIFKERYAIADGPMMCMLKGVCGQCIQWQLDSEGMPLKAVYSCSWQLQPLTLIDIEHLSLRQDVKTVENTLHEKWIEYTRGGDA